MRMSSGISGIFSTIFELLKANCRLNRLDQKNVSIELVSQKLRFFSCETIFSNLSLQCASMHFFFRFGLVYIREDFNHFFVLNETILLQIEYICGLSSVHYDENIVHVSEPFGSSQVYC